MIIDKLPTKTLRLLQIRLAIFDIFGLVIGFYIPMRGSLFLKIYGVFTAFILLFIFWYFPKYISSYKVWIAEKSVIINSGVFIKSTRIMPDFLLIYTQTFTSPKAKKLGLIGISLKAVRNRIFKPEINKSDAMEFLSLLSRNEKE